MLRWSSNKSNFSEMRASISTEYSLTYCFIVINKTLGRPISFRIHRYVLIPLMTCLFPSKRQIRYVSAKKGKTIANAVKIPNENLAKGKFATLDGIDIYVCICITKTYNYRIYEPLQSFKTVDVKFTLIIFCATKRETP